MLTQAEIDALLAGAIEIEGQEGSSVNLADMMADTTAPKTPDSSHKILPFNFWSPDRFSKEQMRAVELVHEDLAERLSTSLPTFLRTSVRPRLVHSEQGRFHDFLKDFPSNTLFHVIQLAPLPGRCILTLSPNISQMVLEQRLGGRIEGETRERVLTEIDQSLLRGLVEHILFDIKSSWMKVASVEPNLEDSTINQQWVQMMIGNERVMLLTFELSMQGLSGTMNLYIPFSTLKPIANDLNPHVWITGRKVHQMDPLAREAALEGLYHVFLPVKVYLGTTKVSLDEVMNLNIGDVLTLDTGIDQDLIVEVVNQRRFTAQVGKSANHYAALITGVIHEDTESA
jgi:flagellar motor switch protein FliM